MIYIFKHQLVHFYKLVFFIVDDKYGYPQYFVYIIDFIHSTNLILSIVAK